MPSAPSDQHSVPDRSRVDIQVASTAEHLTGIRELFREYAGSLSVDLCFQNFEAELDGLPGEYAQPRGCLLLATVGGNFAGCCALRALDASDYANACEMKRLYVRSAFRGLGIGRQLVESILDHGRQAGFECVLLDTLDDMESARALYDDLALKTSRLTITTPSLAPTT